MLAVFVTHNPEDLEVYYGRALPRLRKIAAVTLNPTGHELSTAQLIEAAAGCDVIVSHRSTPGESSLFSTSPRLLAFLRCAVDISDIDVDAATASGVAVAAADKSFVPSTAELALGLLLAVMRNVAVSTMDYHEGRQPPQRPGNQLRGKTAGIIGYGAIGSYLAAALSSLGVTVLVTDPHVAGVRVGTQVEFRELLAKSDIVFPLAPAEEATVNLIGAPELALMRSGAILINVSRGQLLDEQAVADALDAGHLGGLGLDVGVAPDQRPSLDLATRPGVVATPHLGGLTPENADAQAASSVEQVAAIIAGIMPPRIVNPDAASRLHSYWAGRGPGDT